VFDLPKLKCENCGHEWAPRKPEPPKKCPRCQYPYHISEQPPALTGDPDPLARATPEQKRYLVGVLAILRENDPVFAEGIRRAVDSFEHLKRKDLEEGNAPRKRSAR